MNPRIALLLVFLMPSTAGAQVPRPVQPSRADIIAAARDVVQKARYCTFVTNGEDGHPQARIIDPLAPDAGFTIWFATNPLTRKVTVSESRGMVGDPKTWQPLAIEFR